MSLNRAMLIGNLGKDPELRYTGSGVAVTTLSLATNETWKDKDGAKQERVEWHRVQVWAKLAENCCKHLAKGRQVFVEGRIQTRSYEKDGEKRYVTEIVATNIRFLSGGGNGERRGEGAPDPDDSEAPGGGGSGGPALRDDDDIPFIVPWDVPAKAVL